MGKYSREQVESMRSSLFQDRETVEKLFSKVGGSTGYQYDLPREWWRVRTNIVLDIIDSVLPLVYAEKTNCRAMKVPGSKGIKFVTQVKWEIPHQNLDLVFLVYEDRIEPADTDDLNSRTELTVIVLLRRSSAGSISEVISQGMNYVNVTPLHAEPGTIRAGLPEVLPILADFAKKMSEPIDTSLNYW